MTHNIGGAFPSLTVISLTSARPVKIDKEQWPVIASSSDHDNRHECQANNLWWIKVRRHADGRVLVYGRQEAGPGGQHRGTVNPYGGYLLAAGTADANLVAAIKNVASVIGRDDLGADCVADLPAATI